MSAINFVNLEIFHGLRSADFMQILINCSPYVKKLEMYLHDELLELLAGLICPQLKDVSIFFNHCYNPTNNHFLASFLTNLAPEYSLNLNGTPLSFREHSDRIPRNAKMISLTGWANGGLDRRDKVVLASIITYS